MHLNDDLNFGLRSLAANPSRTWLTVLAMALGTAAVVLLSSLGEGARQYVRNEFTQLGTRLLIVIPGRNETTGGPPPLLGQTARDLTLDDALALTRSRFVKSLAPVSLGSAPIAFGSLQREATVIGATSDYQVVRDLKLAQGHFLPPGDLDRARSVAVLGGKLVRELFGNQPAVGEWVRIGDRRFRVIGVLASGGESLGQDLGDLALIPVASAQAMFNSPALFRILVEAPTRAALPAAKEAIRNIIQARHEGKDDVTIIAQDAMLSTFDRILSVLTMAVAGIAAVSLTVAGVLIMNVMLVAVSQRTAEVGLLKAIGARRRQILGLFLTEALLLAAAGTASGLVLAFSVVAIFNRQFEAFQLSVPAWATLSAVAVALLAGLLFGLLPAVRAARLDPVDALSDR
jgi:putative ABC transport system permease protein